MPERPGPGPEIGLIAHAIKHVLPARFPEQVDVLIDVDRAGRPMLPDAQQLLQTLGDAGRVNIVQPEPRVTALADAVV